MSQSTLTVFSGGTAFNSVCRELTESLTSRINHILPVSDNGGSSREIVRVLGGPAIGDIRSRLIRLASETSGEQRAIKALLEYRLPNDDRVKAKQEMLSIVDGTHHIWHPATIKRDRSGSWSLDGKLSATDATSSSSSILSKPIISEAYKQTVRAFLVHFFDAVLRKSSVQEQSYSPTIHGGVYPGPIEGINEFDFRNGSVGNFVFTGARLFFNSLQAAIFWFSNLSNIPENSRVIPVLNVNTRVTIAGVCKDSTVIIGQDEISHPSRMMTGVGGMKNNDDVGNFVDKSDTCAQSLSSPIDRIYYVNQFGSEIHPPPSNDVIEAIKESNGIVYGMGSLYTSIIPSLILVGMGKAIRDKQLPKILLLNTWEDRETKELNAIDYVVAITKALLQNDDKGLLQQAGFRYDASKNIGHSFGSDSELDIGGKQFSMRAPDYQTINYLLQCGACHYVNIIFFVDCLSVRANIMTETVQSRLDDMGIKCIGLKGRQIEDSISSPKATPIMRYVFEANELIETLQGILSRSKY